MNTPLQPLRVVISKTADGKHDYMQIISQDQFSVNIVLISEQITVRDARPPVVFSAKKGAKP